MYQYDISYHEDFGKNNRQKTDDDGENHRRLAIRVMPGRGTNDAVIAARQVVGKLREMQKELRMVCVDLAEAYHRIPRQEVWRCLGSRVFLKSMCAS